MTKKKFEACRQGRMRTGLEPRSAFGEVAEMGNGSILNREISLRNESSAIMTFADERLDFAAKRG